MNREITGSIAMPVKHAAADASVIDSAIGAGMGVALPGQAWLNQLPIDQRGVAFADLPYAQPAPLAIETRRLTPEALTAYADAFIDAQITARASLVTTPAHVFITELGLGRGQDIALAEASIAIWKERQGWRPSPQLPNDPPRELHAAIAVVGANLADAADRLVDLYAELDVAGYWLIIVNGGNSVRQAVAVTRIALGLQVRTGRPVTVSGSAWMHLALLASGVSATCAGLHGMRPTFPPATFDSDDDGGIGIPIFHPAILGAIPLGPRYDGTRSMLFELHPCHCANHTPNRPPVGKREIVPHNTACLASASREAAFMAPVIDEVRFIARMARANQLRARLSMGPLPRSWEHVGPTARSLRSGEAEAEEG